MQRIYLFELSAIFGVTISLATINQFLQFLILVVSLLSSLYGAYLLKKNQNKKTN